MAYSIKRAGLATAAAALWLAATAPAVQAQGFFERLFGVPQYRPIYPEGYGRPGNRQVSPNGRRNQDAARNRVPRGAVARDGGASRPTIDSPSYYTYKGDSLAKVDFAALAAAVSPAPFELRLTAANLRDTLAGLKAFELTAEPDIAKALVAYYSANPDFIWVSGFSANGRAQAAMRLLGEAAGYGLDPADYQVVVPPAAFQLDNTAERLAVLARFEMTLSARVLRYARDAHQGRVDPNRISGYYDFPAKPLDLAALLKQLAASNDAAAVLADLHPKGPEYQALRVELEALQASAADEVTVDPQLMLRPGEQSAELPKLLTLVGRTLGAPDSSPHREALTRLATSVEYAPDLVPVIKAAQEKVGLKADGVIGPKTVAAFAGETSVQRIDKIKLALEELRWLPSDLGQTRVFVNQPAFTAAYFRDGTERLNMRAIIGKPTNQTSFFYDEIEQVDYNPYWGVPQSIIVNEMLPRLRRDPGYLDRAGYEVTDAKGRRIPSSAINWGRYGAKVPFNVRQEPSEANALGELKILFPNKHAIYMHDTPQKELFNKPMRAFSHGCIRLQQPRDMAAAVLGTDVEHVAKKLKEGHSSEQVPQKIPVYVAYFTAWPDPDGNVEYFDDVYDRDGHLTTALERTEQMRQPDAAAVVSASTPGVPAAAKDADAQGNAEAATAPDIVN